MSRFRLLSVLFFFSALFPVLLTAAPRCSSVSFVPFVFPLPSRLISHAFLPVLLTQLSCIVSFRSTLLRSRSRSAGAHLSLSLKMFLHDFRFLSSPSVLGFQLLSFLFLPFLFFAFLPHSGFPAAASIFRLSASSRSAPPSFPCFAFRFQYLAFCKFPFVLPCFAPTAVPQVLPFQISPPGSVPDFRFLSSTSVLASHYSATVLPFPLSSRFCLTGGFSGAPVPLSLSRFFPLFPAWFPVPSFPVLCTRLSVSFLSSYLASLPQPFRK